MTKLMTQASRLSAEAAAIAWPDFLKQKNSLMKFTILFNEFETNKKIDRSFATTTLLINNSKSVIFLEYAFEV